MMLKKRTNFYSPSQFAVASAGILGTTQSFAIDRSWPIEEILLICNLTMGTADAVTVPPDGLLNMVKRVTLTTNDGVRPTNVVSFSGIGLLEYCSLTGLNLDRSTLHAAMLAQASLPTGGTIKTATTNVLTGIRLVYRIPLVHPMITEPLRTRMLCAVNNHPQDPLLTVDFATAAQMVTTTTISAATCEVMVIRRQMTPELNAAILGSGGFIQFDLVETPFTIGTGVSGEVRLSIPTPGQYAALMFRQYRGGSAVTRATLDWATSTGAVETIAGENRWRLETGGSVQHEFKWSFLQHLNDQSRVLNGMTVASSPALFGLCISNGGSAAAGGLVTAAASGSNVAQPSSTLLDFLSDNLNDANELGSLLDCNLPATSGLKMELIGSVASVATNASTMYIGGHRYFGDLSRWQASKS